MLVVVWEVCEIGLFYVNFEEVLIMVLIIEKEIVVVVEWCVVVSVFVNCLCDGMWL